MKLLIREPGCDAKRSQLAKVGRRGGESHWDEVSW
uniref:Uncharacterized protein n=1 Tax=Arundo donax TaxID=35708 RepID=A0A0A9AB88_ARUDO